MNKTVGVFETIVFKQIFAKDFRLNVFWPMGLMI